MEQPANAVSAHSFIRQVFSEHLLRAIFQASAVGAQGGLLGGGAI